MALGAMGENRLCLDAEGRSPERQEAARGAPGRPGGLRVRFLDEEGNTERTLGDDVVDAAARVKKIHLLKNRSSSETSVLLRAPSQRPEPRLARRASLGSADSLNNNLAGSENLNCAPQRTDQPQPEQTKDANGPTFKRNCNVYSVNQAKTLSAERRRSVPLALPRLLARGAAAAAAASEARSSLPAAAVPDEPCKDFTARALGRLQRGLGKLLRRTNSVRISDPDSVYKVAYLGNVLTGWARGESCIEKPLATLWRNYQQSSKPDVVMKLSVCNSGLKGFTKEHGLTEYWAHRFTYCAAPPHYPRLFAWVYRHEGKKLKHELRCHAVLCTKEAVAKKITDELQLKLKQALVEFKKERISKQNARLSLANSVYENPSMPRRKILLSMGAHNYRPPLERSKSAPKLGAIEELCSEEDEEEAAMTAAQASADRLRAPPRAALDRRRGPEARKLSCPEGVMSRTLSDPGAAVPVSDDLLHLIQDSESKGDGTSQEKKLEAIAELEDGERRGYLVSDSDDGSVSSGCETASTATDPEPSSLPSLAHEDKGDPFEAVSRVPLGETNAFRRRCTYPPLGDVIAGYDTFESLIDNLTDGEGKGGAGGEGEAGGESEAGAGDNHSACSDESGYSELLDKDSVVASTIMV